MAQTKIQSLQQLTVSGDMTFGGLYRATNLLDPSANQDAATKFYVDSVAQGLTIKDSVRVATTANITTTGLLTIDGQVLVDGNRVLVKNQSTASQNGIYIAHTTAWTRATDADTWDELISAFVFVETGSTLADTGWVCTVDAGGTLNTTSVTWSQFSGAGSYLAGNGITLTGSTFSANLDAAGGLEFNGATTRVKLNGSTLTRDASGLKVTDNTFAAASHSHAATSITAGTFGNGTGDFTFGNTLTLGVPSVSSGILRIHYGSSGSYAILSAFNVTGGDKTFLFPNTGGTFELTGHSQAASTITAGTFGTGAYTINGSLVVDSLTLDSTSIKSASDFSFSHTTTFLGLYYDNIGEYVGIGDVYATHNSTSLVVSDKTGVLSIAFAGATGAKIRFNLTDLTASRVLELDASKYVISVAKQTGYNLALGTTAGTVAEGNHTHTNFFVRSSTSGSGGTTYTSFFSATPTDPLVIVNGVVQLIGAGNDFTVSGTTLTFTYNVTSGYSIQAWYRI